MVWQHRSPVVVMLTKLVERGRVKADCYWPEQVVRCSCAACVFVCASMSVVCVCVDSCVCMLCVVCVCVCVCVCVYELTRGVQGQRCTYGGLDVTLEKFTPGFHYETRTFLVAPTERTRRYYTCTPLMHAYTRTVLHAYNTRTVLHAYTRTG